MSEPQRRSVEAWILLGSGLLWLVVCIDSGGLGLMLGLAPGTLLLATGSAELLFGGDRRIVQYAALGGVGGVVLSLPAMISIGLFAGVGLALASAVSFVAAGRLSMRSVAPTADVPPTHGGVVVYAKVAVDEALLSTMGVGRALPKGAQAARIRAEIDDALGLFGDRGWLEKPETYHGVPLPLDAPRIRPARSRGIAFEHLSFESEYEPHPDEPGRERWLGYSANRTAHAWVLRHSGRPRPWLICIHGYQMGAPLQDLTAFDPGYYHRQLGLNLLLPTLPIHGLRKMGRRSGDGYLSGNALDTVHAEAQAIWDMRRLISWLQTQEAPGIGVFGLSLGGYNTALLASLQPDLACAIAGVPATDFSRLLFEHSQQSQLDELREAGLTPELMQRIFSVVSPLVLEPKVPFEGRAIFGGTVDRLVLPDQVRDLHEHWGRPPITWYPGGHVTFARDPGVRHRIASTLRNTGLITA